MPFQTAPGSYLENQAVKESPTTNPEGELEGKLAELSVRLGLALTPHQVEKLVRLDRLVGDWNRALPLIGFRTPSERHDRFFLEALHASQWVPAAGEAVDVGSGGGTPALPLAICRSAVRWTLLEPNRRKSLFLQEAARVLGLANVVVERARFEEYRPGARTRVVTTRGLALGREFFERVETWLEPGGLLLLFSAGKVLSERENELGGNWEVRARSALAPRFDAELMVLASRSSTSPRFT